MQDQSVSIQESQFVNTLKSFSLIFKLVPSL